MGPSTTDGLVSDDRIRRPFRVGVFYTAVVLGLLAVAAVFRLHRYRELWPQADWRIVASVPAGLAAACFGYAYLGAAIGARRAQTIAVAILVLLLGVSLYVLTRYMDERHR